MVNEVKNKLPQEVSDYLNSMRAVDLNLAICKKYNFEGGNINKLTNLIGDVFVKNVALADLVVKIKEVFAFEDARAKSLAIDIAGSRLLVVKDYIGGVEEYMKSLGGDPLKYKVIIDDQIAAVKKEKEEWEKELALEKLKEEDLLREKVLAPEGVETEFVYVEPDPEKEKKDTQEIFSSELFDLLSGATPELLEEYNDVLIALVSDEKGFAFRDQLVRLILENKERVSNSKFLLTKKPAESTIGNWLKYFIEEKGSGIFNNIVLTDFLVKSVNAKLLSEDEKDLVKKVLLLYRNLKFFPESMPNQTGEGWEIIPSDAELNVDKARTVDAPEVNKNPIKSEKQLALEKAKLEEKTHTLGELKRIREGYPENSLQRKAVEAEIKKIEKTL